MTDLRAERRAIACHMHFCGYAIERAFAMADEFIQHDLDNPPEWEGEDYKLLYHDLLYQVEQKHPNESRHETAKRLIQNAQRHETAPCRQIPEPPK
jgi:hypothetical protein